MTTRDRADLVDTLRGRVLRGLHAGTLRPGDRLPSARELEQEFGIDHRAILIAYRELATEGLVELRQRGGIYVASGMHGDEVPTPPESWMVDLLAQGVSREVPIVEFHEWFRRVTETLRLRAAVVQATRDQILGLCRELRDEYGLDASGVEAAQVSEAIAGGAGALPADLRRADLLVTTGAHEALVRQAGERLGIPVLAVSVRPDLVGGEWRMLLRRPVYVVVADEGFVDALRGFFVDVPGAENLRPLVVGHDDLAEIPDDAPVYVTRGARDLLGATAIRGRILPSARLLAPESSRALIAFIVRANLEALTARRAGSTRQR